MPSRKEKRMKVKKRVGDLKRKVGMMKKKKMQGRMENGKVKIA